MVANLDELLSQLSTFGLPKPGPETDLKKSRRKTEEALSKMEKELFTEEERSFVVKMKRLREKYNNVENAEYKKELNDLLREMR